MDLTKHNTGHVSIKTKIRRGIWILVYGLLFRPFGSKLFRIWRIFLLRLFGADLQWDAEVYASVKVWAPWYLRMGHRACLGPHVICYNQDWVALEDDAVVSQYCFLCTASHDTEMHNTADRSLITAAIWIRKRVWIGARSFISLGVCIGENAIVGATASVYKTVERGHIVGGNPARTLKIRNLKE